MRRAPVETAQLAQLLGLLGTAGGELQRLAKAQNAEGHGPAEELKECRFSLMRRLWHFYSTFSVNG